MKKPNLFIVGAPRCGTTALFTYLAAHPQVFLNRRAKELHYFGSDLQRRGGQRFTEGEYLAFFTGATTEPVVGEASTSYFYSKNAAAEIRAFSPSAKIIIMLRDPVEMMYSLHAHSVFSGSEPIDDFEAALEAESERKRGLGLPDGPCLVEGLLYREIAGFTRHVSRYFEVFGTGSVHVIIFDDFKRNTSAVYGKALQFLGVDTDFRPSFDIVNANPSARLESLHNFVRRPPRAAQKLSHILLPERIRRFSRNLMIRLNTAHSTRPPLNSSIKLRLQSEFVPEVERLSRLLRRDLTHWCKQENGEPAKDSIGSTTVNSIVVF